MDQRRMYPRWLLVAAGVALVIALASLALRVLVVSAMGWLIFEIFVVLSAIFITTPKATTVREQNNSMVTRNEADEQLQRAARAGTARIYDSPVSPTDASAEEIIVRNDNAP